MSHDHFGWQNKPCLVFNNVTLQFLLYLHHFTVAVVGSAVIRMKVVVCGGGVIGICTAYYLHLFNIDVTLVERSKVACGASGKAGGFLAKDWCTSNKGLNLLAEAGFHLHKQLAIEHNGSEVYDFRPLTAYSVALSDGESSDKQTKTQSNCSYPQWIDKLIGDCSTEKIGSTETTAQLHPRKFVEFLSHVNKQNGIEILSEENMCEIVFLSNAVKGVKLSSGKAIACDCVVLCMGPWTGLAQQWAPECPDVYGQKAHSIIMRPSKSIPAEAVFADSQEFSTEIYPRPDGEVYICGITENPVPSLSLPVPESVVPSQNSCQRLKSSIDQLSSVLCSGDVIMSQACYIPLTHDGLPLIGKLNRHDDVYIAAGHGCWGILLGPITGKLVAELIATGKTNIDLTVFDPNRFV